MRELAIGDIHGCLRAFRLMLDILKPGKDDTVIVLGDYIDRGPDSCGVIETILELSRQCTLVPLAGNHEKMLLGARNDPRMHSEWLIHGGKETLNSYALRGAPRSIKGIPPHHWYFLSQQVLDYWETEETIFVHATVDPEKDMQEQTDSMLFWEPFTDPTLHKSGKSIVCGHKSQKFGLPAIFVKGVCIDTWAHGGGWLTCFNTGERTFLQTNEMGQHRAFGLDMLKGS